MRILYVITHGKRGGAQKNVLSLAGGMKALGHEVTVCMGEAGWLCDELAKLEIPAVSFKSLKRSWNPLRSVRFISEMRDFLKAQTFDVAHFHSSNSFFGILAMQGGNAPKTVATIHGLSVLHPGWKKSKIVKFVYKTMVRFLLARTDSVIFVNHSDKLYSLRNGIVSERNRTESDRGLPVVYNGISNKEYFLPRPEAREILKAHGVDVSKVIVGTIARLDYQKNLEFLIRAVKLIENESVRLVILGQGPAREALQSFVSEEKLEGLVHMISDVDSCIRLLPAFDIFVLSSRYEGLPYTLLESAKARVPVIATNVGGVSELIDHGKNGRLVLCDDDYALSRNILDLVKDEHERERLAEALFDRVQEKFSEDEMVRRTENVYQSMVERNEVT